MKREFTLGLGDFPQALPHHLTVGEEIELVVRARVIGIREDVVDVTTLGSPVPTVAPAGRSADFLILAAGRPS